MKVCSICQLEFAEFGNNPYPVNEGRCCDQCNASVVIPARLNMLLRNTDARKTRAKKLVTDKKAN